MNTIKMMLIATVFFLTACDKKVEEVKQDLVIQAMTSGRWYVQEFKEDASDVTSQFSGYEFQFYADGKVEGIKPSKTETGTWSGDANALTINANFPTANDTIKKFNALWKISNNSLDYVKATTTLNGVLKYLHLKKK